jgi:hypothetical protein
MACANREQGAARRRIDPPASEQPAPARLGAMRMPIDHSAPPASAA